MSHKARLQPYIDEVKAAGLRGESMQDKLASIVDAHDLTPHEIRRIAEDANRGVHISLTKNAHAQKKDARLRFELADPEKLVGQARKSAEASMYREGSSKLAAIEEAGGDPFAPLPEAGDVKLSIYDHPMDPSLAYSLEEAKTRSMLLELDKTRAEVEIVQNEAKSAGISALSEASDAHDRIIQSAIDMVMSGVTLPSLYRAVMATVSGCRLDNEKNPEELRALLRMVVEGLKSRGVPNHRLGFRFAADKNEIDQLSIDDIVSMCENAVAYDRGACPPPALTKQAQYYLQKQPDYSKMHETGKHPYEDAAHWFENRPSQADHKLPQTYLDERNTGNTPGGTPRIVNGDSSFTIAVKDLVGARDRLLKTHNAQEYLGLKLKEISEATGQLKRAQHIAAKQLEAKLANPLLGLAARAIPAVASAIGAAPKKTEMQGAVA
ncbi:MAG: hypothetical protein WC869_00440 [Phycisphaerae bacterium]|jgi:hypothetical protein